MKESPSGHGTIPSGFLSRWCEYQATSESPPEAYLASGLVLLSSLAGQSLTTYWGPTRKEPSNLWVLNVGESALARKTSGMSGFQYALNWARDVKAVDQEEWRIRKFDRLSDAGLVDALDVVGPESEQAYQERLREAKEQGTPPPEWVEEVHRSRPMTQVAVFNEVAPLWKGIASAWVQSAQSVMISAYDGELSSTTKATRVIPQRCYITALGNIPPAVLKEETTLELVGSGFVGRWVLVPSPAPEHPVAFLVEGDHVSDTRFESLEGVVKSIARESLELEGTVDIGGSMTPEAARLQRIWYEALWNKFRRADNDAVSQAQAEYWGRAQATSLKVAAIVALSRLETLEDFSIQEEDVAWSLELIDRAQERLGLILAESGAGARSPLGRLELRVIGKLKRSEAHDEDRAITLRELCRTMSRDSSGDVHRAVDNLLQSGQVEAREVGRSLRVWLSDQSVGPEA